MFQKNEIIENLGETFDKQRGQKIKEFFGDAHRLGRFILVRLFLCVDSISWTRNGKPQTSHKTLRLLLSTPCCTSPTILN